jgi:hypothetical protein
MGSVQDIPKKTDFVELQDPKTTQTDLENHIRGRILTLNKNFDVGALIKCIKVLESF